MYAEGFFGRADEDGNYVVVVVAREVVSSCPVASRYTYMERLRRSAGMLRPDVNSLWFVSILRCGGEETTWIGSTLWMGSLRKANC